MDCGPTCLRMVAAFHGKNYTLPYLRAESHISREGVSMEGICNAAEQIGFRAMGVKIPFSVVGAADEENVSLMRAPLPCIVHWQQKHFVVVKKVTPQYKIHSLTKSN
jgi:ATP-binding cassette, subfamily B, bacterial